MPRTPQKAKHSPSENFQPVKLKLEGEDIHIYRSIADGIGVTLERCVAGFASAPLSLREETAKLWLKHLRTQKEIEAIRTGRATMISDVVARKIEDLHILRTIRKNLGLVA